MLLSKSNSSDSNYRTTTTTTTTTTVQTNTACDQSSNVSDSGVKSIVPDNSSNDSCVSKLISHKEYDLLTSQTNDNETTFNYELSSFITKVEQVSDILTIDSTTNTNQDKHPLAIIKKPSRSSPILHRLLLSPTKPAKILTTGNISSPQHVLADNHTDEYRNDKSPQYRPRHSSVYPFDKPSTPSENILNKTSSIPRKSCRSPVYTRRSQQQRFKIINTKCDPESLLFQPIALLSLDTNGNLLQSDHRQVNSSNKNKRALESSCSEQILIKRRHQKSIPIIIVQRHYCVTYPTNIQRCVDCQTIDPPDLTMHLSGCRFQYCRTLQYLGDDRYEVDGFTTPDKAKSQDLEHIVVPNSSDQPALSFISANYVLTQISKLFCLMLAYEQAQQSIQTE
ncbi:unnamed protein product, partial [Adineta ricciae]